MKQLNVAVIGQGRSGLSIHCAHLSKDTERFKIKYVVDPLEHMRKNAEEKFGCETFAEHTALFDKKDIDLVVNATPSYLHVPYTKAFLERGFNVLCEKPLAKKVSDVDDLIATAKKNNVLFAIFQQSRFAAYYQKVREIIDSGILGRILQVSVLFGGFRRRWDWQTLTEFDGGELMTTCPHPMDQALMLFSKDANDYPNVVSMLQNTSLAAGDAENFVKVVLYKDADHPVVDVQGGYAYAYAPYTYKVDAEFGGILASQKKVQWKYIKPEENKPLVLQKESLHYRPGLMPHYCTEDIKIYEEEWEDAGEVYGTFGNMTGAFYDNLYKALTEGAPLEVTPEQVRRQIAVIEECHRQNPWIYGEK
jgi:scyllo-inositol 2-dehydrogenase (NADP+)